MKGLIAVAMLLGIAGTALGVVALVDDEKGAFEKKTLNLTDGKEIRTKFRAQGVAKGHPLPAVAWTSTSNLSGDATGEHVRTCIPITNDNITCSGAFILKNGTIEFTATEELFKGKTNATASIIGGDGAYEGASGTIALNYQKNTYGIHLLIPRT
jgi:hypothetical protein